jgi:hypothetical protein
MFLRVWRFLGLGLGFQKVPVGSSRSRKTEGTSRTIRGAAGGGEWESRRKKEQRKVWRLFGECLEIIRARVAEVPLDSSRRRKKREGRSRQEEESRN